MERNTFWSIMVFVALSMLTGCISNPLNAYTGRRYYEYGVQAENEGNWTLARQNFSKAYTNAQIGNLGPSAEAYCIYEWSRMTGYLGMYADAEKGFKDVLALIDKAKGKADELRTPTLCELARLLHDTDQHDKAIAVYDRALMGLAKTTAEKDDPIAFADFLEDYAGSLRATKDNSKADEIFLRAKMIRETYKGLTAKHITKRYKTE